MAAERETNEAGLLDAHVVLEQLAFVLRSVAEDASEITGLSQEIAERLGRLTERIANNALEMEQIASAVKPDP